MSAAVKTVLLSNLKTLKLASMLKHFEEIVRQTKENRSSYEEFLLNLTEVEVSVRKENGRQRRIREANFPLLKPIETFNFSAAPDLDARFIKELTTGGYIKEKRNVIFLGKSGTGKTHLATALGMEACSQGNRTRFVTGCALANELIEARNDKVLSRVIKRYASCNPLIIDELGYVPFSKEGAELLFQVLADRHEMRSVIITTNMGFGDWTQIFGDPNLTAALLDRITHKAHVINCTWDSYRLKETLKKKK
jgi:DNA replication protein DnaC